MQKTEKALLQLIQRFKFKNNSMGELHLFIIWENGRHKEDEILNDIAQHFFIIQTIAVKWSEQYVTSNYSRFYGTFLPKHSFKEKECGKGEFLLVIVRDDSPVYNSRKTNRGNELVNTNMFDAKEKYRTWTGGGHKIHATNNPSEFNHDITLLLGINSAYYQSQIPSFQKIKKIERDISGANGWKSVEELFYVLNNTIDYVILRGLDVMNDSLQCGEIQDVDILVRDYATCSYIINGAPCCSEERPHQKITIENRTIYLDLWDIHRDYYDIFWSNKMLQNKVFKQYYYTLDETNSFYCLLYHCLINKNQIASKYNNQINVFRQKHGLGDQDLVNLLVEFLKVNKYEIVRPRDNSVGMHIENPVINDYYNFYGISINKSCCEQKDLASGELLYWKSCVYCNGESIIKIGTDWLIENEKKHLDLLSPKSNTPIVQFFKKNNGIATLKMSRIPGFSLNDYFSKKKNIRKSKIVSVICQLVEAIIALRNQGIIHRDLCSPNIIINEELGGKVFIIDFGWAISITDNQILRPCNLAKGACPPEMYSDFYTLGESLKNLFPKRISYLNRIVVCLQDILWSDYKNDESFSIKRRALYDALKCSFSCKDYIILFFFRHKLIAKYCRKTRRVLYCFLGK